MTDEIVIETSRAVAIFTGGLDDMLAKIAEELRAGVPDISTEKGRKEIASRAYKAARCKTQLDNLGKGLNEDTQKKIDAVNADRKRAVAFLDNLRDEIRKPLDEYEDKERARIAAHETAITELEKFGTDSYVSADDINSGMVALDNLWRSRNWEEFAMRAESVARGIFEKLKTEHATTVKYEADQAELAKLRAEQARREEEEGERRRIAREAQIATEAAEKARIAAEEKAAAEAKEAADKAARELERQKREAADAEDRARMAEARRVEEAAQAERNRLAAEEKARRDAEAAVEVERKRVAAIKAADDAAAANREADKKHRGRINSEAATAIKSILDSATNDDMERLIVIAIAKGEIPHVSIRY